MSKPYRSGPANLVALGSLLLLVTFSSSCRLFRHRRSKPVKDQQTVALTDTASPPAIAANPADPVKEPPSIVAGDAEQALISRISRLSDQSRSADWTTFYARADVRFSGKDDTKNFDIDVRIKRDKRIWIRVIGSLLGIKGEGARVLITPDSIQALDKMNSIAYMLPWKDAGKILPSGLDFATVQTLFTGGVYVTAATPVSAKDDVGQYELTASSDSLFQKIVFQKTGGRLVWQQLRTAATDGPTLVQEYSDYREAGKGPFAHTRAITVIEKGVIYKVDLNFNKVEWNGTLEYPFSVPPKYERK